MPWGGARGQKLKHLQNVFNPYLDNYLSEILHTWTIGTLYGKLSFHDIGSQGPCPGMGLQVKI